MICAAFSSFVRSSRQTRSRCRSPTCRRRVHPLRTDVKLRLNSSLKGECQFHVKSLAPRQRVRLRVLSSDQAKGSSPFTRRDTLDEVKPKVDANLSYANGKSPRARTALYNLEWRIRARPSRGSSCTAVRCADAKCCETQIMRSERIGHIKVKANLIFACFFLSSAVILMMMMRLRIARVECAERKRM